MIQNVWLVLALPALGFLVTALAGRPGRKPWAGYVASAACGLALVVAMAVWSAMLPLSDSQKAVNVTLWSWVVAGDLTVPFGLLVDPLSAVMLLIITGVGFLIHVYAIAYMAGDRGVGRFFACMNLFILAMSVLVLANNFMLLIVGWGGVGLASYLLISFWFEKDENARAGVKAFVVNSIGDIGLMAGAFMIFATFGSLDFDSVFAAAPQKLAPLNSPVAIWIALALLVAAIAKSGQLPLHVWLPDAMAGPTPVSALIHAATMVTAGVYLICRAYPLFQQAPTVMLFVAVIGAATALMAATIGLVQPNIKRVLAYSTISQLGFMFVAAGLGAYSAAIFHLTTHALFKAALFLAAGGVIHALHGEEDLGKMGGLRRRIPWIYAAYLSGALALAGIPVWSGFFSKEEILQAAFDPRRGMVLGLVLLATSGLTGFYIFRSLFLAFHGQERVEAQELDVSHLRRERRRQQALREHQPTERHLHALSPLLVGPTAVLGVLSLLGSVLTPLMGPFLEPVFARYDAHQPHSEQGPLYWSVMVAAILVSAAGIAIAYLFYVRQPALPAQWTERYRGIYQFLMNRWYVDQFYDRVFVRPTTAIGAFVGRTFDPQVIDAVVTGVSRATSSTASSLRPLQSGFLRTYALAILAGTVAILLFVLIGVGRS